MELYRELTRAEIKDGEYNEDYEWLVGPNNFLCVLGEPEDRRWSRDGADVVKELNRLASKLRELIELLEAADDEIFHSVDEYTGQHFDGCLSCRIMAALNDINNPRPMTEKKARAMTDFVDSKSKTISLQPLKEITEE